MESGKEKQESSLAAQRLFPSRELRLARHHNRAEALLIARYACRQYAGQDHAA
ncbi:MAG: hypothetical protein NUV77_14100 [Thermoguttaceae bacterium]|nr:hypothetical protein [Thermoguttaceae bacterium]